MAQLIVYYAHPGHKCSRVNRRMARAAQGIGGITFVDLYGEYPRFDINVNKEQQRLLEHGFAYGADGDMLAGKRMMLAVTGAGPEDAYRLEGYQHYPLRTFLTPLEQTARLCKMRFTTPYVLYASLRAPGDQLEGKGEPA